MEVNNAAYDSSAHSVGKNKLVYVLWYFIHALFFLNPLNPISKLKIFWLKLFGAKIGNGVIIKPRVSVKYPWKLTIGDNCWIGEYVWIDNIEPVIIGSNVCISQGALLLTGSHDHNSISFDYKSSPIIIENGVWIGAKAVVGRGVRCKSHSILGINSVAEKDLEEFIIYKGNPLIAVTKRKLNK